MATNVLIAHRNSELRMLLYKMLLEWGYDVTLAADGIEAWATLQSDSGPRLAILDARLTGIDALELCRHVRVAGSLHYKYLLLLSGGDDTEKAAAALDAGADDYITCALRSDEFRSRVQAGMRIVQFQERLLKMQEQLYEQATRDSLTGLWNRIAAIQILECEIARAARSGSSIAVIMADLDDFKSVNDSRGHLAGDSVLREAARRLSGVLRKYDAIGRYGGEEFLIVVPACHFRDSLSVAERLQESVSRVPFSAGRVNFHVTCSFGLSWHDCCTPVDATQLLREADLALYAAKRKGRNRVEVFGPESAEIPQLQASGAGC